MACIIPLILYTISVVKNKSIAKITVLKTVEFTFRNEFLSFAKKFPRFSAGRVMHNERGNALFWRIVSLCSTQWETKVCIVSERLSGNLSNIQRTLTQNSYAQNECISV